MLRVTHSHVPQSVHHASNVTSQCSPGSREPVLVLLLPWEWQSVGRLELARGDAERQASVLSQLFIYPHKRPRRQHHLGKISRLLQKARETYTHPLLSKRTFCLRYFSAHRVGISALGIEHFNSVFSSSSYSRNIPLYGLQPSSTLNTGLRAVLQSLQGDALPEQNNLSTTSNNARQSRYWLCVTRTCSLSLSLVSHCLSCIAVS